MSLKKFALDHLEIVSFAGLGFVFWIYQLLKTQSAQTKAAIKLSHAVATKTNEAISLHPEVNLDLCAGCGTCTKACPEGDILQLINNKAVLVSPTKCVGHGECERSCPMNAISLVFGSKSKGIDLPRLTSNYETNVPGLYIAGELGGMGLIRNAFKQGALATKHALSKLSTKSPAQYDVLIVGAGPAGLAAALTCIEQKKSYQCIEQNKFGGTIANFPKQKLVMSHQLELPLVGKIKFNSNQISKEDLINQWSMIRLQTGLSVKENCRFIDLKSTTNAFEVNTTDGVITAKKVILAMGVRGTPRKLNLANENLTKVTYNLMDANQYTNKSIAVVGGGNAAVEAALALCNKKLKNKVHLLVRGETFDRCNDENLNKIQQAASQGHVQTWFNSSVEKIEEKSLTLKKQSQTLHIENDFLFIFAGAEIPTKFLMSLGIQFEKKFGEGLKKSA